MVYRTINLTLTALVVVCTSSVLASRHHPRSHSSHRNPSFLGYNENYRAEAKLAFSEFDTFRWPSSTADCLRSKVRVTPDGPARYLHDGQVYDRHCLKTLAYLVGPDERAVCRKQSDCHDVRGYDDDCLIRLSFDQSLSLDLEGTRRQELEWKQLTCHGKTLDQCGRDHSLWWRSLFPSSLDDCRIRGWTGKEREGAPSDNWVPWSIGPNGATYDTDCLSRFASRLEMKNPGNCTQTNNYVIHNHRDVPPTEIPETLVHAPNPSGIRPDLEFPTTLVDPDHLTATPVPTYIPMSEDPVTDIMHEPLTTGIPRLRRKRSDIPPSPVRTLAETADAIVPTSLPLVNRAQSSDPDEWSCMWDVNVTLPDFSPRMFDAVFGNSTVDEIRLGARKILKGEPEILSGYGDTLGEEIQTSLFD